MYFLKPTYSLRNQLLLGFGTAAVVVAILSLITTIVCYNVSSNIIENESNTLFQRQVMTRLYKNSRYVAKLFRIFTQNKETLVYLINEVVMDRIVGYPEPGWENDTYVPFKDMDTGRNIYPLKSKPLPLDWDIDLNINDANKAEQLQERSELVDLFSVLSTSSASYFMQGACDPNEWNNDSPGYYENCSEANNDVTTGGIINPTNTSYGLYTKSADLGVLLKPLYESYPEILQIAIYYHNSGAGSVLRYPGSIGGFFDTDYHSFTYTSKGCDWMRTTNKRTRRPLGTEEEIARCHPNGTQVARREFNPNEVEEFQNYTLRNQVDENRTVFWSSPHLHILGSNTYIPTISINKVVYDQRTQAILGWIAVHMSMKFIIDIVAENRLNKYSEIAVANIWDGQIYADSLNISTEMQHVPIYETDFMSRSVFDELNKIVIDIYNDGNLSRVEDINYNSTDYFYIMNPLYEPRLDAWDFVIHRISYEVFSAKEESDQENVSSYNPCDFHCIGIFLAGLVLTFGLVLAVAKVLTRPFLFMERLAWGIINHNDKHATGSINYSKDFELGKSSSWLPSTEITELVFEFRKMINGFSGTGASRIAETALHEVVNKVSWQSDFQKIYLEPSEEQRSSFVSSYFADETNYQIHGNGKGIYSSHDKDCGLEGKDETSLAPTAGTGSITDDSPPAVLQNKAKSFLPICPAPPKLYYASNILQETSKDELWGTILHTNVQPRKSRLFWSILLLIVLPVFLTNLLVGLTVTDNLVETNMDWVDEVKMMSLALEMATTETIAVSKSNQITEHLKSAVRDLHLMTRLAGWLHFGAINRSDALTQTDEGSELCKEFSPSNRSCPVFDTDLGMCPCEWDDPYNLSCTNMSSTKSPFELRLLQNRRMFGQRRDADSVTGIRYKVTNFGMPGIDDAPENTSWWSNFSELPGAYEGSGASGYEKTNDRLRVSSAMSVVDIPLYNFATRNQLPKSYLGSMVAFEADGLGTGYRGCQLSFTEYPFFLSSEKNNASVIAPDLCPLGKYGYDPRCRRWYSRGKNSQTPLQITAPYLFATGIIGVSLTSPLINPNSNEYIGQVLLDYVPVPADILDDLNGAISFLISLDTDVRQDTVIGPNKSASEIPSAIANVLFPNDDFNVARFEAEILPKIKDITGSGNRTLEYNGSGQVFVSSVVSVRALQPVQVDDFSRGVAVTSVPVYVACVAYKKETITKPWDEVQADVEHQSNRLVIAYAVVIFSILILYFLFIYKVTYDVTGPMIMLLRIVKTINEGIMDHDIPPLHGGSREVHQVYACFAKLVRTVRMSNTAFFSGDLTWAFEFISDALQLFRTMGNQKAQGIASSNLGNTLQAMYHNGMYSDNCCSMADGSCYIKSAIEHYNESIAIAEQQLQNANENDLKAAFAQQLADRLFNCGLFLLLVCNEPCAPGEAKRQALAQIARARELDDDVKDFWLEHKMLLKKSDDHYSRLLRRSLGLLGFFDDEELRNVWDVRDLIHDADQFLVAAWNEISAPLFQEVSREGRLQQLECVSIRYLLCSGDFIAAASLGIRMFVEDSYLLDDAFKMAAVALTEFSKDVSSNIWNESTKKTLKSDLRKMLRKRRRIDVDVGKCIIFAIELDPMWDDHPILEMINSNTLALYDDCCFDDDLVGVVAHTFNRSLNLQLRLKSENEGLQRSNLDIATSSTSSEMYVTSPFAIQMIIDNAISIEIDSFVVLILDGSSFDGRIMRSLKLQIQRLNEDRETQVHIFILGIHIDDDKIITDCKFACSASKLSEYFDITVANIDSVFGIIRNSLRGPLIGDTLNKGITMEKF